MSKGLKIGSAVRVKDEYTEVHPNRLEIGIVVRHVTNPHYFNRGDQSPAIDNVVRFESGVEESFFDHELEAV